MNKKTLIIATRESPLALWQANWVKKQLKIFHPKLQVKLLGITTTADKMMSTAIATLGGKGLFVKELEEALLRGDADIAVHSMKDMPMNLPDGLTIPVMCQRLDARDAFISNNYQDLKSLPVGSKIGTSSLRRQSQLLALRNDIEVLPLRGNVGTRLNQLDDGKYAALILAAAGLKRLDLQKRIKNFLSIEESLPAPGQGVLGIECREQDQVTQQLISSLNHFNSFTCVTAERAMCQKLDGGCQKPIGAYAEIKNKQLILYGYVGNASGTASLRIKHIGEINNAVAIGEKVADVLIRQGAKEILCQVH